jgi:hypothetical protein
MKPTLASAFLRLLPAYAVVFQAESFLFEQFSNCRQAKRASAHTSSFLNEIVHACDAIAL